jgi:hypothetical protein
MFLAREPLFDLAGKLVNGTSEKRAAKKRRKAEKVPKITESAP